jgi:hypothetical protein
MDATTPEVRELLHELTLKIQASNASLDAQAIGNALYGLQCMDATTPEVRELLHELTLKIQASTASLDAQAIGNALYGLQNMSLDHADAHTLLFSLVSKFPKLSKDLQKNRWEWSQAAASYLQLKYNSPLHNKIGAQVVKYFFPGEQVDTREYLTDEFKALLVASLKKKHLMNCVLDLHELDHLSARLLLTNLVSKARVANGEIRQIICGRGSHSKTCNQTKMRDMLVAHLQAELITTGQWDNSGAIKFESQQITFFDSPANKNNQHNSSLEKVAVAFNTIS